MPTANAEDMRQWDASHRDLYDAILGHAVALCLPSACSEKKKNRTLSHRSVEATAEQLCLVDGFSPPLLRKAHTVLSQRNALQPDMLLKLQALLQLCETRQEQHMAELREAVGPAVSEPCSESAAVSLDDIEAEYCASLQSNAMKEFDMTHNGVYMHYFRSVIEASPPAGNRPRMKRLLQEQQALSSEGTLPVHAAGAIFVRNDESRIDVLKALISGPADTPYALGLFLFDIFMPPTYPQEPPTVNLQTTGNGMVRFNPNLYSDGKVCLSLQSNVPSNVPSDILSNVPYVFLSNGPSASCASHSSTHARTHMSAHAYTHVYTQVCLSLLGTWHGEGWTAPTKTEAGSTLLQVLVSIQVIIYNI